MDIPRDNRKYKDKSYWDERFESESTYDWLAKYDDIKTVLKQYIRPTDRILLVGCGNAKLSAALYQDGYEHLTNLDFSKVVIDRMAIIHQDKPNMKWIVGDMTTLDEYFAPNSFDVVIDKAAMDALMCDEGDVWSPSERVIEDAKQMCLGISSVLTSTGIFLQLSFGQPHFRKRYVMGEEDREAVHSRVYGWTYTYHKIEVGLGYFFYVLQKQV